MIRRFQFLSLFALCLLVLLAAVVGQGQITPSQDAYTDSATPTKNYGSATVLTVDGTTETTYIQFNLASIPSGATISQATLKLYVNAVATAGSFNVDYVNGTWSESTITYNMAPVLGAAIASNVAITTADKNQYILINVTAAVQAWLSGSQANDGIALVANGTFNASFDSKESTKTSHPPELDIVFAGGGTITGVLTGAGSGLTGGGTSGTLNLSLVTSCASGQVLAWKGSAWGCSSVGTGTITGVTAGTDLTGGGASGNVTLNLDTTKVPQLATANTFAKTQTVASGDLALQNGNLDLPQTTGGGVGVVNVGGTPFVHACCTTGAANVFLGVKAGNFTTTGGANVGSGFQSLFFNTTGTANAANGYQALASNTTGNANTASGSTALLSNTTGLGNTASGSSALFNNVSGSYNTASGTQALYNNTDFYNTAIGYQALFSNTTGNSNTASGYGALYNNTTAQSSTADGFYALFSNTTGNHNTASGFYALANNTTGSGNMASGDGALNQNTTGSYNTGCGSVTLVDNHVGSYNTALGYFANVAAQNNFVNATAIGAYAFVSQSNTLVLGSINGVNGATASTNVGIGTSAPSHIFTIGQGAGHAIADGWDTYSSRRWKTNIHTLHGALSKVQQLRGVSYDLKDSGKHEVGVIAEEVGAVVPEVVSWDKNGKNAQGVDYSRLTALLIEATKEQQALIHQQQEQIRAQQAQINAQQAQNKVQQAQIARLSSQVKAIQASLSTNSRTGSVRAVKAQLPTMHQ